MTGQAETLDATFERVQSRMREMLSLLDHAAAAPERLAEALVESGHTIKELSERLATLAPTSEAERDRIQDGLERALRLNSVAIEMAESQTQELVAELNRTRNAHRALRKSGSAGESGGSCNVAG